MKTKFAALVVGLLVSVLFVADFVLADGNSISPKFHSDTESAFNDEQLQTHVEHIDRLIDAALAERGIQPNPQTADPVFLRRIYLDIIGRIPTLSEATEFLQDQNPLKRRYLIDKLLNSEGYVSREFNYWADLLRAQSNLRNAPGQPYLDWIKNALRKNQPYDAMVRELITAEGYIWDNGAAGYYLRDAGMELDHLANEFQVFLGTQIVCAQCHNHPYDDYTQKDYYQQAAYLYGVKTTDRKIAQQYRQLNRSDEKNDTITPETKRIARQMIRPLRYRVHETKTKLRLPHDYQYDDAQPKSLVKPHTLFGDPIQIKHGQSPRDAYAQWLTSPNNPRFALVIANRLWKRALGVGLIEPVDNLSDATTSTHPQLTQHLTQLIIQLNFNLKNYQRILYNTQTYQRSAAQQEPEKNTPHYYHGPYLKRMTAEQLWDSILTLLIPDPDQRKAKPKPKQRYTQAQKLIGKNTEQILTLAQQHTQKNKTIQTLRQQQNQIRQQLKTATNPTQTRQLKQRQTTLAKKIRQHNKTNQPPQPQDPRWKNHPPHLLRASELPSPAPPQHFLHQFGQSDRQTIENANTQANIPQTLTLLNGPLHQHLTRPNTPFSRNIRQTKTPDQLLNTIYLTILTRHPNQNERQLLLPQLQTNNPTQAAHHLAHTLLNTRQFTFIQ